MKSSRSFTLIALLLSTLNVPQLFSQNVPADNTQPAPSSATSIRPTYVLGAGDQITIRAYQVEEISGQPFPIGADGNVNLPVLGQVHAGGLTVEQFEADLTQRLKSLVKNPQVTVAVTQYRSEPIFVTGYFKTTGILTLQGKQTLLEVLTKVGGLQPNASRKIKVTRRLEMGPIPLPSAITDPEKKLSTVGISIADLTENLNPSENIVLQPFDAISADRAELVYVNGEVNKPGGVELGERDSISLIQLISTVGGLGKDAAPGKARILRPVLNTSRRAEIPVDLTKVLAGGQTDLPLYPNDVLYVPKNSGKLAWGKIGVIAVPVVASMGYVLAAKL